MSIVIVIHPADCMAGMAGMSRTYTWSYHVTIGVIFYYSRCSRTRARYNLWNVILMHIEVHYRGDYSVAFKIPFGLPVAWFISVLYLFKRHVFTNDIISPPKSLRGHLL